MIYLREQPILQLSYFRVYLRGYWIYLSGPVMCISVIDTSLSFNPIVEESNADNCDLIEIY